VQKYLLTAAVYEQPSDRGTWRVEAIDMVGSRGVFVTLFAGPDSKVRAFEYARAKYEAVDSNYDPSSTRKPLGQPVRRFSDAAYRRSERPVASNDADLPAPAPRRLLPG
jgi:hypothetical protein